MLSAVKGNALFAVDAWRPAPQRNLRPAPASSNKKIPPPRGVVSAFLRFNVSGIRSKQERKNGHSESEPAADELSWWQPHPRWRHDRESPRVRRHAPVRAWCMG